MPVSSQARERRATFGAGFVVCRQHSAGHALHQVLEVLALRDRHRLNLEKRLFDEAQRMIAFAPSDGTVQTTTLAAAKLVTQELIKV